MKKILVFGSNGLVGSSLKRFLQKPKFKNRYNCFFSTRQDTNLLSFEETYNTISKFQPDVIIIAAAKVGGILANNEQRFEFITKNLRINLNIFESCKDYKKIKIINLGSSCVYPLGAKNPIKEEYIMSGKLEPTNSPYAMAKLSSIEMANSLKLNNGNTILNLMPTNLYGPNDNFSKNDSHVIPGLISKMHEAKINKINVFEVWGTGKPLREFLYVDDLAEAIIFLMENNIESNLLNIGSNEEVSIKNLAKKIKKVINFKGEIVFNENFPDGNPRKLLDSSKIFNMGWKPKENLESGLKKTYNWYLENITNL